MLKPDIFGFHSDDSWFFSLFQLKLEAKVYLMDENSQTLICVEIPVEIKDGIIKN